MDFFFAIKSFLDGEGRLAAYPTKRGKKLLALHYLAARFERGRRYTEAEVNQLLGRWHTFGDPALLRRELYNGRFMNRARDGSAYWLEEAQPPLPTPEKKG